MILIDEAQDLAGYDFDFIASLMQCVGEMTIVGDPRQRTYTTNNEPKHRGRTFFDFVEEESLCPINTTELRICYRCPSEVIKLANRLYPGLPQLVPYDNQGSSGGFQVCSTASLNVSQIAPGTIILCMREDSKIPPGFKHMTMGKSKGMEFDDVAVVLTREMSRWLMGQDVELKPGTRAKLYVAITRARSNLTLITTG